MVPTVALPFAMLSTLQLTARLLMLPVTLAANACDCVEAATAARLGDSTIVTLGAATVKLSGVVGERLPDIPVTVTADVPVGAVVVAVRVSTLVVLVEVGLNDADTPVGSPDADKATLPLKPFTGVTVMVLVTL